MLSDANPDDGSDESNPTLHRLAKALGLPPVALFDATGSDLSQTVELLRSWNAFTDKHDREKVLAIVRTVASRA